MSERNKTGKKLTASVVAIVVLIICLCITTFALIYSAVAVENNLFQTGTVQINLNNGQPVIEEDEFLFEPGMTVEKNFFIENQSTCDVYYRLYFDNTEGNLADVLDVTIQDGDTILYHGKASDLTKNQVSVSSEILRLHQRQELTITFHYPEGSGNSTQNQYLSFDLKADAVQIKNNPDKLFE